MNIGRVKEIEQLSITPEEALEYALIKNNSWIVEEALKEHGLDRLFNPEEHQEPEDALEYAIDNIPKNILTTLLNAHGYQPIPKSKQLKRDNAMLLKPY